MNQEEALNNISKKNLGQLLTTLEELNCNSAVITIVKTFFWKNLDELKQVIEK
jgi:hypothetical protein